MAIYHAPGIVLHDPLELLQGSAPESALQWIAYQAYQMGTFLFREGDPGEVVLLELRNPGTGAPLTVYLDSLKVTSLRADWDLGYLRVGGRRIYAMFASAASLRKRGLLSGEITREWAQALVALALMQAAEDKEE